MILDEILAAKRLEVAASKAARSLDDLHSEPLYESQRIGFASSLRSRQGRAIIAEIKKASPSKGLIRADFEPQLHARQYERGGACCISVLTDFPFFQGSLEVLRSVREACSLALLRKDFIIDAYQITEARAWGADAILLIVAALGAEKLKSLSAVACDEGLDVLVEVHNAAEMALAIDANATMIGVNNRDLRTFETSLNTTRTLAPLVPDGSLLVSESGFCHPHELSLLEAIGVDAFLIGESLMASPDPGERLRFFIG